MASILETKKPRFHGKPGLSLTSNMAVKEGFEPFCLKLCTALGRIIPRLRGLGLAAGGMERGGFGPKMVLAY